VLRESQILHVVSSPVRSEAILVALFHPMLQYLKCAVTYDYTYSSLPQLS